MLLDMRHTDPRPSRCCGTCSPLPAPEWYELSALWLLRSLVLRPLCVFPRARAQPPAPGSDAAAHLDMARRRVAAALARVQPAAKQRGLEGLLGAVRVSYGTAQYGSGSSNGAGWGQVAATVAAVGAGGVPGSPAVQGSPDGGAAGPEGLAQLARRFCVTMGKWRRGSWSRLSNTGQQTRQNRSVKLNQGLCRARSSSVPVIIAALAFSRSLHL